MRLKKALSIILAVCMVLSSVSIAYAQEITEITETKIEGIEETVTEVTEVEEKAAEEKAEEAVTEETKSEETEEAVAEETKSEETEEEKAAEETKEEAADIVLTAELDDVIVTLKADADAFDNKGELSLKVTPVEIAETDEEALDAVETENVAKRVTYDITVYDDGEEIEPVKEVKVSFELKDAPSGADGVNIYHHDEEEGIEKIATEVLKEDAKEDTVSIGEAEVEIAETAEKVTEKNIEITEVSEEELADTDDVEIEDDVTVEATTDSFSLYTVDFTYKDKTISIDGDTTGNKLDDIVDQLGIEEKVEEATTYQDAECTDEVESGEVKEGGKTLFSVYEIGNEWYVDAVNAFDTEHGLVVKTADGAEYKIKVTDATIYFYMSPIYNTSNTPTSGIKEWEKKYKDDPTGVTSDDENWGTAGNESWYVVKGSVEINTTSKVVTVKGNVNLILADGCNLTVGGGIVVTGDNKLTIYTGRTGLDPIEGTGKLTVTGVNNSAGIGGGDKGNGSNITINGGTVEATGSFGGAGIGGGGTDKKENKGGDGSNITINSGIVTANGGTYGAGIGGGNKSSGSNITINGGNVIANGGAQATGIGGGYCGSGSNITINGGEVTANAQGDCAGIGGGKDGSYITINGGKVTTTGGSYGAGIGGGSSSSGNNITINSGNVKATGGSSGGAGIGGGWKGNGNTITINGGTVTANGGSNDAAGIGNGKSCSTDAKDIYAAASVVVKASASENPAIIIPHGDGDDLTKKVDFNGKRYVTAELPTYTVTFDMQSHGAPQPESQNVAYEGNVTKPASPSETGYEFGGWYKEAGCTNAWAFDTDTVKGNTTLYAKWVETHYLTFTAQEANSSVTFNYNSGTNVQYNKNDGGWTDYTKGDTITLANIGDKVSFKGTYVATAYGKQFTMTGKIAASGDVTSLTNGTGGDVALTDSCYRNMFVGCTSLTTAPELPSTTLSKNCYLYMFYGCKNLTTAPALPSTDLAYGCYCNMFDGCTSLTTAPELKATTLAGACYFEMFNGCTSLKVATTGNESNKIFTCPDPGILESPVGNMFAGTGGTFTGTPEAGKTYYVEESKSGPKTESKSSGSSSVIWTSVPTSYGSSTAPINNGTWGGSATGTWQYKVNGETLKNATAWISYTGADGKAYTGCFYFDKNGNMATNWQKIDNIWYFFDTTPGSTLGMMKTSGWITTDGKQYYVGADGKMLANTTTPDGHKVDATGARID